MSKNNQNCKNGKNTQNGTQDCKNGKSSDEQDCK